MTGQVWNTDSLGGYMYSDQLSDTLRHALQPMTRFLQHCDADDFTDKGLHVGDTFTFNQYSDVATQGGQLDENQRMPETNFTITQGTGQVYEYGNSVPYTGVLDNRSKQPVKQIIHKVLRNDATKAFEAAAHTQFAATPLTVTPSNVTTGGDSPSAIDVETTGTPTLANNIAMGNAHVKLIADEMKERDIPVFADGNYRSIGRPSTYRDFKDDLEAIHQYQDQGFQLILNGEIGRSYEGIRFFEQTAVASQGWSNGLSDQAFFFGEDTVIEAIVVPTEVRGKLPTDYGRDRGVAWYAEEGFQLVHSTASQARILEWASAT